MSTRLCLPAGEYSWGPGGPGSGANLLVGGLGLTWQTVVLWWFWNCCPCIGEQHWGSGNPRAGAHLLDCEGGYWG